MKTVGRQMVTRVGVLMLAVALAGCSAGTSAVHKPGSSSSLGASTVSGLMPSQYPECGPVGESLAKYLGTGKPTTDDLNYGNQRQQALSMSGQAKTLFIRQQADAVIEQCDQNYELQAAQVTCQAVGGTAAWVQNATAPPMPTTYYPLDCNEVPYVDFGGFTTHGVVPMDPATGKFSGPLEAGAASATQQQCETDYRPGESTPSGTWNSTLQACLSS